METKSRLEKDMEFLVKELSREWEQSKRTLHTVTFHLDEAENIRRRIQKRIKKNREDGIRRGECSFKESMKMCKEDHITLRLGRKFLAADEKAGKGQGESLILEMDKEEYSLFRELLRKE